MLSESTSFFWQTLGVLCLLQYTFILLDYGEESVDTGPLSLITLDSGKMSRGETIFILIIREDYVLLLC